MGTRSTFRVIETWKGPEDKLKQNKIALMYVQFDGYPEGHPMETAEWLSTGQMVNGIGMDHKGLIFNGAGCLAAQLVAKYKDGPGGAYLYPMAHRGHSGEDYLYDIIVDFDTKSIRFKAFENYGKRPKKIFDGTPADFVTFAKKRSE